MDTYRIPPPWPSISCVLALFLPIEGGPSTAHLQLVGTIHAHFLNTEKWSSLWRAWVNPGPHSGIYRHLTSLFDELVSNVKIAFLRRQLS